MKNTTFLLSSTSSSSRLPLRPHSNFVPLLPPSSSQLQPIRHPRHIPDIIVTKRPNTVLHVLICICSYSGRWASTSTSEVSDGWRVVDQRAVSL